MTRANFTLAAAVALLPLPALAALPPCAYDELVGAAPVVVQIEGISVGTPEGQPTYCEVSGTVAHVLRGDVAVGDPVTVAVACEFDGMVGALRYHDRAALNEAELIELHLTGEGVAGYGAGLVIVPAETAGTMAYEFQCGKPD